MRALAKCPEAAAFLEPVDPVALNLPTYTQVVHSPMDLGTVRHRLESGAYSSAEQCRADILLTFDNALAFNPLGHPVHACAAALKQAYTALCLGDEPPSAQALAVAVRACHEEHAAAGRQRVYEAQLGSVLRDHRPLDSGARQALAEQLAGATGQAAAEAARVLAMRVSIRRPDAFARPQDNGDCAEVDFDSLDQLTVQVLRQHLSSTTAEAANKAE